MSNGGSKFNLLTNAHLEENSFTRQNKSCFVFLSSIFIHTAKLLVAFRKTSIKHYELPVLSADHSVRHVRPCSNFTRGCCSHSVGNCPGVPRQLWRQFR